RRSPEMDFGVLAVPEPRRPPRTARLLEELGFDTALLPDSQNLAPEVWGQLMLAAQATTRVRLGPGVTNSVTRDPAVTASAALALQAESGGRAVLGIGRGDSSVQRIGKREDRVAPFERYLAAVQRYLRGEVVDRDGFASRLEWLERVQAPKVPVEVAATGPRVIEVAARHADAICLAVGADPAHLGAVLAPARAAARAAGIGDEFVDWFAIAGPPDVARERFRGLAALGLDFCHVIPGSTGMPREVAVGSLQRLAGEVMPALRG